MFPLLGHKWSTYVQLTFDLRLKYNTEKKLQYFMKTVNHVLMFVCLFVNLFIFVMCEMYQCSGFAVFTRGLFL